MCLIRGALGIPPAAGRPRGRPVGRGPPSSSQSAAAMNASESQQDLLKNEARASSSQSLTAPAKYILGPVEKHFLLSAERGDCATVRRLLEEHQGHPEILNIDCVDPLNRSALIAAIENENIDLILLLLELGIQVKVKGGEAPERRATADRGRTCAHGGRRALEAGWATS